MERSSGPPARARSPRTTCASSGSTSSPRARPPSPPDRLLGNEDATEPRRLGAGIHQGDLARSSPARFAAARRGAAYAQTPDRAASQARLGPFRTARADARADRGDRDGRDVPDAVPAARLSEALGLAHLAQRVVHLARGPLLLHHLDLVAVDLQVDLLAEYRDLLRRLNADPHLLADDREHGDLDVVPDHDALVGLTRQDQQFGTAFLVANRAPGRDPVHRCGKHSRRTGGTRRRSVR